jgi:deazaflavin-dependent oxidoreductase (nitroreductase family)
MVEGASDASDIVSSVLDNRVETLRRLASVSAYTALLDARRPNLRAMRDGTAKNLSTLHTLLYRMTRGRVGKRLVDNDMLLLSTIGRRTGNTHTVPLLYLRDGDDFVVIASWGGRHQHPEWYLNLLASPRARVQVRRRRFDVHATTADPHRRSTLWPQVLAAHDGYRTYQGRTSREIPVVILTTG